MTINTAKKDLQIQDTSKNIPNQTKKIGIIKSQNRPYKPNLRQVYNPRTEKTIKIPLTYNSTDLDNNNEKLISKNKKKVYKQFPRSSQRNPANLKSLIHKKLSKLENHTLVFGSMFSYHFATYHNLPNSCFLQEVELKDVNLFHEFLSLDREFEKIRAEEQMKKQEEELQNYKKYSTILDEIQNSENTSLFDEKTSRSKKIIRRRKLRKFNRSCISLDPNLLIDNLSTPKKRKTDAANKSDKKRVRLSVTSGSEDEAEKDEDRKRAEQGQIDLKPKMLLKLNSTSSSASTSFSLGTSDEEDTRDSEDSKKLVNPQKFDIALSLCPGLLYILNHYLRYKNIFDQSHNPVETDKKIELTDDSDLDYCPENETIGDLREKMKNSHKRPSKKLKLKSKSKQSTESTLCRIALCNSLKIYYQNLRKNCLKHKKILIVTSYLPIKSGDFFKPHETVIINKTLNFINSCFIDHDDFFKDTKMCHFIDLSRYLNFDDGQDLNLRKCGVYPDMSSYMRIGDAIRRYIASLRYKF